MKSLLVKFNHEKVGELTFDAENEMIQFRYDAHWVTHGFPLSPHIPLTGEASPGTVRRFLENLFPEGEALAELLEIFRIGKGNIFRITQLIGRDATGALLFISPDEDARPKTEFRPIGAEELEQRLDDRASKGLIMWDGKARLSVAGVQDKLPVTVLSNGSMGLGEGEIASTHILKFQKEEKKVPHLVLNEYFCMTLAKKVGLDIPKIEFRKFGKHPALLVERFDREIVSDRQVKRLHIIDGCQALDLKNTYKYERNMGGGKDVAHIRDGASLIKLFEFCMQTRTPAKSMQTMLRWVLFNLCISNSDAHGKNVSFFVGNVRERLWPSPWYDLVNVAIYPELDKSLAMAIGDEFDPDQVRGYQLIEFCHDCGIAPRLLKTELTKMLGNIRRAVQELEPPAEASSRGEKKFWNQLSDHILTRCKSYDEVVPDLLKIKI